MKTGLLYFHQGWTDIVNCLALLDYYNYYNELYFIVRSDAAPLINYYITNKPYIKPIYVNKNTLDTLNMVVFFNEHYNVRQYDILFHGGHDHLRIDGYTNRFNPGHIFFVEAFYSCYDIDYMTRIQSFNLNRNHEVENHTYNEFIQRYGTEYVLHHEIPEKSFACPYINLNGISDIFFDYIKVLEHSKEIHLLDSIWGAIVYLLDCKYKIFQHLKIFIHCIRGYTQMFNNPVLLNNWVLV